MQIMDNGKTQLGNVDKKHALLRRAKHSLRADFVSAITLTASMLLTQACTGSHASPLGGGIGSKHLVTHVNKASAFTQGDIKVITNNDEFKDIVFGSTTENACSPQQAKDTNFVGIAINVPSQIYFNEAELQGATHLSYLPLCGYYSLDMASMLDDASVKLYVLNMQTEDVHKGVMVEEEPGSVEPFPFDLPPVQAEDVEGQLLSTYFNPNVADYVFVPAIEGDYKVLVQIGNTKSNIVDVSIKLAPKDDK